MAGYPSRGSRCAILLAIGLVAGATITTANEYWPLERGAAWVYRNAKGVERSAVVVGRESLEGEQVAMVEHRDSDGEPFVREYFAERDGVLMRVGQQSLKLGQGGAPARLPHPAAVWPAAPSVGARWKTEPDVAASPEAVVERVESVTVPAGAYEAFVAVTPLPNGAQRTEWVARGVGVVKTQVTQKDGRAWTDELVRFTPGDAAVTANAP